MDCRGMCGVCHTLYSLFIACPKAVQYGAGIETHVRYFQLASGWRRVRFPILRRRGREGANKAVRGWKVPHVQVTVQVTARAAQPIAR